jgi:hypothetical protein
VEFFDRMTRIARISLIFKENPRYPRNPRLKRCAERTADLRMSIGIPTRCWRAGLGRIVDAAYEFAVWECRRESVIHSNQFACGNFRFWSGRETSFRPRADLDQFYGPDLLVGGGLVQGLGTGCQRELTTTNRHELTLKGSTLRKLGHRRLNIATF